MVHWLCHDRWVILDGVPLYPMSLTSTLSLSPRGYVVVVVVESRSVY